MFWLILAGLVIVCCVIMWWVDGGSSYNGPGYLFGIAIACCVIGFWMMGFIDWQTKAQEMKILPITIQNKVDKINQMKNAYYAPPQDVRFNVDLANRDLANKIANEVKDLEQFVNEQNEQIITWSLKYKYRFWNTCQVKPVRTTPIRFSDYKF